MHILVVGASGFIASQFVTDLIAAGHQVTCCVRQVAYTQNAFPNTSVIACDFLKDTQVEKWLPRLQNIDVVINCVGIFYHPLEKTIWKIHHDVPRALFDACVKTGVKKVIYISALGVDKVDVAYAKSKKAAEDYLLSLPLEGICIRPSLVYASGSYGGTSLFRGLVGLPWVTPITGKGEQQFQPIHLEDLSKGIVHLVAAPKGEARILSAVGPKRIMLKEILTKLRQWLRFPKARPCFIPWWIIRIGCFFGDFIPYSVMNRTAFKMMAEDSVASQKETQQFQQEIGFVPKDFNAGIDTHPSSVQDHWHARLFFVRPLLQFAIGFIWLWSGLCSAYFYPMNKSFDLLAHMGVMGLWQPTLLAGASFVNILLGLATLAHYHLKLVCTVQILIMLVSTLCMSAFFPQLWLEPFAPIAKNIPLLVATLVLIAVESDK